ncbi:MAG TPA: sugar phosphate isomerase/epimerase [Chthonomonadales bacterium]|nr:sugar phosphate isomerase/epimerase [Chthonomonadales bacterium]
MNATSNAFSRDNTQHRISRRQLLRTGALAAASGALGIEALAQANRGHKPWYGKFRMGIQSYSLRGYSLDEALERTEKLGIAYWEAYPGHIPQTNSAGTIQGMLAKLKARGVYLRAWGVQGFDGNEAKARATFEFARAMGLQTITADPSREALPILDKLVEEYKINIAIHNHGPGSRYDKIDSVAAALAGHHPRIGACVDTGHYLRSGEDPVEAIHTFGKRVYSVHLKDVKDKTQFTTLGRGDLDTVGVFRALRKLDYPYVVALEYEEHPENPCPDIDLCLATARDAINKAKYQ